MKNDAKAEASQKSFYNNEMARAISNKDSANAGLTLKSVAPLRNAKAAASASFLQLGRACRGASFEMAITDVVAQTLALASLRLSSPVRQQLCSRWRWPLITA